jgi:DNA-binding NtrC family response regulator
MVTITVYDFGHGLDQNGKVSNPRQLVRARQPFQNEFRGFLPANRLGKGQYTSGDLNALVQRKANELKSAVKKDYDQVNTAAGATGYQFVDSGGDVTMDWKDLGPGLYGQANFDADVYNKSILGVQVHHDLFSPQVTSPFIGEVAKQHTLAEVLNPEVRDSGEFAVAINIEHTSNISFAEFVADTSCPEMEEAYKAIGRVADQTFPVLITGESGTGKELVARAIYQHGPRAQATFLALNCAAIPENLLESELFGHEKGAFTGADRRRIGKFEQCSGGTLFLDEIGDMPPATQAKMLRVLQEQAFERVGGNETIRTDVRLIAATHRDLKAWSTEGKFRPDLFYRLGVFTIQLPPLRERGDDLPLLAQHYLRRFSSELGREVRQVAPEAMTRLRGYSWPGNIRELQSVLKQALLQASGTVLLPAFLPEPLGGPGVATPPAPPAAEPGVETFVIRQRVESDVRDLYAETHRQVDRLMLPRVLEHTRGNLQHAALLLGIARQTLRLKLRDLGLYAARPGEAEEDDPV